MSDSRAEFEAWVASHGGSVDRLDAGEYRSAPTECAWDAWQASRAQPERKLTDAPVWVPITDYGQVKVGDKLRFTLCGETHNRKAKLILNAGTDQEEIIYDKGRNYYLITSMAIAGKGSQKNVEVLAAQPAAATVPDSSEAFRQFCKKELAVHFGKDEEMPSSLLPKWEVWQAAISWTPAAQAQDDGENP